MVGLGHAQAQGFHPSVGLKASHSVHVKMSYSAGPSTTRLSSDNILMKRVIHIGLCSSSAFATLLF